jgi:hypothetical protein
MKLRKNKICALLLIFGGAVSVLLEGDSTFLVFTLMIGIPLLFSKQNWIY